MRKENHFISTLFFGCFLAMFGLFLATNVRYYGFFSLVFLVMWLVELLP